MSEEFDEKCSEIFEEIEEVTSKYGDYILEVSIVWKQEDETSGEKTK